ncbi:hypothetical protein O1W68_20220 [Rhodococcus sp. H36-A4]|uniref:hypothetical protein n=1 Tax=Rhodococcus sp. H36-A4 TaxID=3004353 RepID=UPI0022B0559A|nr:hypothetical protein [Rhodococcus sp. H36-A4]MCZ4080277.1 hypothetical protein [Rhodococcus sp. H36-A4]
MPDAGVDDRLGRIAATLETSVGNHRSNEYARSATGDGQREILAAAIRPMGNTPTGREILTWLASGEASRGSNNQWPLEISV